VAHKHHCGVVQAAALEDLLDWMELESPLDRTQLYRLASLAADMHVTQVCVHVCHYRQLERVGVGQSDAASLRGEAESALLRMWASAGAEGGIGNTHERAYRTTKHFMLPSGRALGSAGA
jgi:hypothetical protein